MVFMNEEEKRTLRYYAKVAKVWNDIKGDPESHRKEFEEFRYFFPKGRILDVGCGGGRDALLFQEYKPLYTYIGIDASPEMLSEARKLVPNEIFLEMNMYSMNFGENFFDGFWAMASLFHIPKKRYLKIFSRKIDIVLGQIRKVVKKNGLGFIGIVEGVGQRTLYNKGMAYLCVFYSEREFSKILKRNKFEILKLEREFTGCDEEGNKIFRLKYFVKLKK